MRLGDFKRSQIAFLKVYHHEGVATFRELKFDGFRGTFFFRFYARQIIKFGFFDVLRATALYPLYFSERRKLARKRQMALSATLLLRLFLKYDDAEEVIANFDHYYKEVWSKNHSPRIARLIVYAQTIRAIIAYNTVFLTNILERWIERRE